MIIFYNVSNKFKRINYEIGYPYIEETRFLIIVHNVKI